MKDSKLNIAGAQNVLEMIMKVIFNLATICNKIGLKIPKEFDPQRSGVLMGIYSYHSKEAGQGNMHVISHQMDMNQDESFGTKWMKHYQFVFKKVEFLILNPNQISSHLAEMFKYENVLGGIRLINGWVIAISGRVKQIDELIAVLWQHYYFQNSLDQTLDYAELVWKNGNKENIWITEHYIQEIIKYIDEFHYSE